MHNEEAYLSLTTRSGETTWKQSQNNHLQTYCHTIIGEDMRSDIVGMEIYVKAFAFPIKWRFSYWEKV